MSCGTVGACYDGHMSDGQQMRALIFEGPNRLSLREIPRPEPGDGEVLIRVHVAAICGSDVRIMSGRKTRDVRMGYPIGHECAGTIAAIGKGVEGYEPGERVAVCVVVSCGECDYCKADKENLCDSRITLGYHTDGAFAEYMLIPAHAVRRGNLFKLPADVPMDVAPLLEPMACCINGQYEMALGEQDRGKDLPTESLVIFGAGPIGLLHLMLAKAKGLDAITVVEPIQYRREMADQLGADIICPPEAFDEAENYDAAILAVGKPELINLAQKVVKRSGKVSLFAGFDAGASVTIDPNLIHYKQLHISGAPESRRGDFAEALSLVTRAKVDPSPLIAHRFSLDQYRKAFQMAADRSALKVIFEML